MESQPCSKALKEVMAQRINDASYPFDDFRNPIDSLSKEQAFT
jgi:hypothetical protein